MRISTLSRQLTRTQTQTHANFSGCFRPDIQSRYCSAFSHTSIESLTELIETQERENVYALQSTRFLDGYFCKHSESEFPHLFQFGPAISTYFFFFLRFSAFLFFYSFFFLLLLLLHILLQVSRHDHAIKDV